MIVLPTSPRPVHMEVDVLDFGSTQRGASSLRVDRPGGRHRITFTWATEVMRPPVSSGFVALLKRGKRQGVRIPVLLPRDQPAAGTPVVNGAGQSGTVLSVRGFTPNHAVGQDFWFTIVDASGRGYLHTVVEAVTANGSGVADLEIEPPLRSPFSDGAEVNITTPFIEGELVGESFSYSVDSLRQVPLTITIEEQK